MGPFPAHQEDEARKWSCLLMGLPLLQMAWSSTRRLPHYQKVKSSPSQPMGGGSEPGTGITRSQSQKAGKKSKRRSYREAAAAAAAERGGLRWHPSFLSITPPSGRRKGGLPTQMITNCACWIIPPLSFCTLFFTSISISFFSSTFFNFFLFYYY